MDVIWREQYLPRWGNSPEWQRQIALLFHIHWRTNSCPHWCPILCFVSTLQAIWRSFNHVPIMTMMGVTNNATCMLDPTATPNAKSIYSLEFASVPAWFRYTALFTLFLYATVTAVTCSAALEEYWFSAQNIDTLYWTYFPTMGSRISPTKVSLICHCSTTCSIADTKNSAQTATNAVMTNNLHIVSSVFYMLQVYLQ